MWFSIAVLKKYSEVCAPLLSMMGGAMDTILDLALSQSCCSLLIISASSFHMSLSCRSVCPWTRQCWAGEPGTADSCPSHPACMPAPQPWTALMLQTPSLDENKVQFTLVLNQLLTKISIYLDLQGMIKTRVPKGPCVAHLRKRSKVTVETFTEDY